MATALISFLSNAVNVAVSAEYSVDWSDRITFSTVYATYIAMIFAFFFSMLKPMQCLATSETRDTHGGVTYYEGFCASSADDLFVSDPMNPKRVTEEMERVPYYHGTPILAACFAGLIYLIFLFWRFYITKKMGTSLNNAYAAMKHVDRVTFNEQQPIPPCVEALNTWMYSDRRAGGDCIVRMYVCFKVVVIIYLLFCLYSITWILEDDYLWPLRILANFLDYGTYKTVPFPVAVLCQPHAHKEGPLMHAFYMSCILPLNFIYFYGYLISWVWIHFLVIYNTWRLFQFKRAFQGEQWKKTVNEKFLHPFRETMMNLERDHQETWQESQDLSPNILLIVLMVRIKFDTISAAMVAMNLVYFNRRHQANNPPDAPIAEDIV